MAWRGLTGIFLSHPSLREGWGTLVCANRREPQILRFAQNDNRAVESRSFDSLRSLRMTAGHLYCFPTQAKGGLEWTPKPLFVWRLGSGATSLRDTEDPAPRHGISTQERQTPYSEEDAIFISTVIETHSE